MILAKLKNCFWGNIFSSIGRVYLSVSGVVNVILLFPGLEQLQEKVYSIEMSIFQEVLIAPFKFVPVVVFAFIN